MPECCAHRGHAGEQRHASNILPRPEHLLQLSEFAVLRPAPGRLDPGREDRNYVPWFHSLSDSVDVHVLSSSFFHDLLSRLSFSFRQVKLIPLQTRARNHSSSAFHPPPGYHGPLCLPAPPPQPPPPRLRDQEFSFVFAVAATT